MTTCYVSQSTANGYAVGSDSNNGTSQTTPWLTVDHALATAPSGSTIIVNDGTYQAATYFSFGNSGQILIPQTPGACTLQCAAGNTTAVLLQNAGGVACTVGNFNLDCTPGGAGVVALQCNSILNAGNKSLGIDGPNLVNTGSAKSASALWLGATTAQLTGWNIKINGAFNKGGVFTGPGLTTGFVDIDGISGSVTSVNYDRSGGVSAYSATTGYTTGWMRVRRCSLSVATTGGNNPGVLLAVNLPFVFENNREMIISGTSTSACITGGLMNNTNVINSNQICRYNRGINTASGHYLHLHGFDGAATTPNAMNYPVVHDNDYEYSGVDTIPHGYILGDMNGGVVSHNIARGVAIPFVSKYQSERSYWVANQNQNWGTYTGASGLYAKGTVNALFASNVIYVDANDHGMPMESSWDGTSIMSTGTMFIGNIVSCTGYAPANLAQVGTPGNASDTSAATFFHNDYYTPGGVTGNPWTVGASTTYASLSAWQAVEQNALAVTPIFSGVPLMTALQGRLYLKPPAGLGT